MPKLNFKQTTSPELASLVLLPDNARLYGARRLNFEGLSLNMWIVNCHNLCIYGIK